MQKEPLLRANDQAALRLSLKKSFLYRAQAVFLGRMCLNGIYLLLWLSAPFNTFNIFPNTKLDLVLIIIGFLCASFCYQQKSNKKYGRWLHFFTMLFDVLMHVFFTRSSGYLLSPLMAIHPFLSAAFLLLFHNPMLMLTPLATLPLSMCFSLMASPITSITPLVMSLLLYSGLDALTIFFIHLTHSKEHKLLRSLVFMEKKLQELAILKERQRISKEFHDGVGAKMASIVMQCDYLQLTDMPQGDLKAEILEIKESAVESIDDMRRSIASLNGDFEIVEQIEQLILKTSMRHRLTIEKSGIAILTSLSLDQQIACCRIIQESLTNSLKHSGASKITIKAEENRGVIRVSIEDNGIGFQIAKKQHHFGIKNMTDRASHMGGNLTCSSTINAGTKIMLEIPVG